MQCGRPGFDPWVGTIPKRREKLPIPVFFPGEFHGLYSPWGSKESDVTERLSLHMMLHGLPRWLSGKESTCQCRRLQFNSWVRKIHWRRDRQPTLAFLGFPCGSAGKESTCSVGDLGLTPGLGRSPGEGKDYLLQDSGLENSKDCIVHGSQGVRHD